MQRSATASLLPDPDSFGFLVTDVARLIRAEMDRRIAGSGLSLTPAESRTLVHAARAGAVRQALLAERMGIEPMTLSLCLDKLEARGLIERRPDPDDRRAKVVHLTPAADEALVAIRPIAQALKADAAHGMDAEDWIRLCELLKQVRANLSSLRGERTAVQPEAA
jgi:DNA-binding MarR family transcriptional regulator